MKGVRAALMERCARAACPPWPPAYGFRDSSGSGWLDERLSNYPMAGFGVATAPQGDRYLLRVLDGATGAPIEVETCTSRGDFVACDPAEN